MSNYRVSDNVSDIDGLTSTLSRYTDTPTAWQRLSPEKQAYVMNKYRYVLMFRRIDGWPDVARQNGLWRLRSELKVFSTYGETHEHASAPTELHHWHQQVIPVVDAGTVLTRGQLLTWDLDLSLIHI